MLLALQAVRQAANAPAQIVFSLNNTSALTHSTDPAPTSGQHLCLAIRRTLEELKHTHVSTSVLLSSSPGHVGVAGTEVADLAAKEAVREWVSVAREREKQRERKTHLKRRLVFVPEMAELSDGSSEELSRWKDNKRPARHLAKLAGLAQRASRSARYNNGLSRCQSTLLCRLQTNPSKLNAH
jgi:hypothetical protein